MVNKKAPMNEWIRELSCVVPLPRAVIYDIELFAKKAAIISSCLSSSLSSSDQENAGKDVSDVLEGREWNL